MRYPNASVTSGSVRTLAATAVPDADGRDALRHLLAVRADVLHRRRARRAGDAGQRLDPGQLLLDRVPDDVVPGRARRDGQRRTGARGRVGHLDAAAHVAHDDAVEARVGDQQVRAAADAPAAARRRRRPRGRRRCSSASVVVSTYRRGAPPTRSVVRSASGGRGGGPGRPGDRRGDGRRRAVGRAQLGLHVLRLTLRPSVLQRRGGVDHEQPEHDRDDDHEQRVPVADVLREQPEQRRAREERAVADRRDDADAGRRRAAGRRPRRSCPTGNPSAAPAPHATMPTRASHSGPASAEDQQADERQRRRTGAGRRRGRAGRAARCRTSASRSSR